jgi:hypothetical protein
VYSRRSLSVFCCLCILMLTWMSGLSERRSVRYACVVLIVFLLLKNIFNCLFETATYIYMNMYPECLCLLLLKMKIGTKHCNDILLLDMLCLCIDISCLYGHMWVFFFSFVLCYYAVILPAIVVVTLTFQSPPCCSYRLLLKS